MNRLQYLICAKTQYNIQSPFLFDLYQNVLAPKLDSSTLKIYGIAKKDRFAQLHFKLANHYNAKDTPEFSALNGTDVLLATNDGCLIGMMNHPYSSKNSEERWHNLVKEQSVTLSVDLYDIGLVFTSKLLSKQHLLFREFL